MKICILNIATNKYIQFLEPLRKSIEENFLRGYEIDTLVFTNHDLGIVQERIKISKIEHESWPIPTLKRYHYFMSEKERIIKYDYCFYLDVDMKIVNKIGDEILGDLVAVQHPAFWFKDKDLFTYERRSISTAYVPYNEGRAYYSGAFNGGRTENFLKMSETIMKNVDEDFKNDIIAVWHDESHMNRYMIDNPPTLELTPSYYYPEAVKYNPTEWNVPFEPKILALEKNHSDLRV